MIIGIDQSWACTSIRTSHGSVQCITRPDKYPSTMARLSHIMRFFGDVIGPFDRDEQKVAVIEGYSMASTGMVFQLGELGGALKLELYHRGWTTYVCAPGTLKKFVTGKGSSKKGQMQLGVYMEWGYKPVDDNDADAYSLWQMGKQYMDHKWVLENGGEPKTPKWKLECFEKMACIPPMA